MNMNKKVAVLNPIARIANTFYLARWFIICIFAVTFSEKKQLFYYALFLVDLAAIVIAVLSLKAYYPGIGILIFVSEILLFIKHFVQLLQILDENGDTDYNSQFATDFFTHIGFWSYIIGTIIEFVIMILVPLAFSKSV